MAARIWVRSVLTRKSGNRFTLTRASAEQNNQRGVGQERGSALQKMGVGAVVPRGPESLRKTAGWG